MACFADTNVSQGSVATYMQGVVGFKFPFDCEVTKESSSEEKKINRLRLDRIICGPAFLAHAVFKMALLITKLRQVYC